MKTTFGFELIIIALFRLVFCSLLSTNLVRAQNTLPSQPSIPQDIPPALPPQLETVNE